MKTIEEGRSWLKADEWDMEIETDQQKGVPHPPLQKPVPEGTVLIELIPPERISLGDVPLRGSAGSGVSGVKSSFLVFWSPAGRGI